MRLAWLYDSVLQCGVSTKRESVAISISGPVKAVIAKLRSEWEKAGQKVNVSDNTSPERSKWT
jgi:hypothetical protein